MDWLKGLLGKLLLSPILGSFVRHALTAFGAILAAKGIASESQATSLVNDVVAIAPGALMWVLGQATSLIQKANPAAIK